MFSRVLPARFRRAYHNDVVFVRVVERFDISQPPDWYRLNRAAVVKEFPHDKEVRHCSEPTCAALMACGAGAAGVQGAHLVGARNALIGERVVSVVVRARRAKGLLERQR